MGEVGISISLIKLEFCAKRAEVTGSVLVRILRVLPPHCGYGLDSTPPLVILKCLRLGYRVAVLIYYLDLLQTFPGCFSASLLHC